MKRLFPAIALMFVVALSSFTVISSPAKDEQGKSVTTYYKFTNPGWESAEAEDIEDCEGDNIPCVLEVISGNVALAQDAADDLTSFPGGDPVTLTDFDPNVTGEQAIVHPQDN